MLAYYILLPCILMFYCLTCAVYLLVVYNFRTSAIFPFIIHRTPYLTRKGDIRSGIYLFCIKRRLCTMYYKFQ